jgi:transposase
MGKKNGKKTIWQNTTKTFVEMPVVNPKAAGIDVGSRSFFVRVGQAPADVREFGIFTCDLHDIAKYLKDMGYTTVAMESTGFYWKQLFVLLQDYGFEVMPPGMQNGNQPCIGTQVFCISGELQ